VLPDLARQLRSLIRYSGSTPLTLVDEGSVEPSPSALPRFLRGLQLNPPVAVDRSCRIADGYEVQDQPWFVLTSASGRFLWYYDVSTAGWLSPGSLAAHVRAAFAHAAKTAPTAAAAAAALSAPPAPPPPLPPQPGRVQGPTPALPDRLGGPTVTPALSS